MFSLLFVFVLVSTLMLVLGLVLWLVLIVIVIYVGLCVVIDNLIVLIKSENECRLMTQFTMSCS